MGKRNDLLRKLLLQLMAVNILAGLVQPFNQFIDSALTGKGLGTEALEAYALFLPVGAFVLAAANFFAIGTQVSCSHKLGGGKSKEAREFTETSYIAAISFSLILAILIFLFPNQLAAFLGAKGDVQVQSTGSYIRAYAIGIPAILLVTIGMSLLQLEGKKSLVVLLSFCIFVINAVGDLLNLYIFHKGLPGMAMATSVSNIVVFIILIFYFLFKSQMFPLSIHKFRKSDLLLVVKNGFPSLSYFGSIVIRTAMLNYLILVKLDGSVLAVMAVVNSFETLVGAFLGGTGDAVLLLGGVFYGEKNIKGERDLLRMAQFYGTILMILITVFAIFAGDAIGGIFASGEDGTFISNTATAISLMSLCFVPDIMQCVFKKYIQAVGRAKFTSISNILLNVIYMGIAAVILTELFGFTGFFLSFLASNVLILVTQISYALVIARKSGRRGFDVLLYLPENFEISDDDMCEFTVSNIEECIEVSRSVGDICKERTGDKVKSYRISLFVEEVVKNIIEHGFQDDRKNHIVVRVLFIGEDIRLTIRDDCPLFDPKAYYDLVREKEDAFEGIGIRLVVESAKKTSYTNCFHLNNLLIEV